jgi:hypothetical protein
MNRNALCSAAPGCPCCCHPGEPEPRRAGAAPVRPLRAIAHETSVGPAKSLSVTSDSESLAGGIRIRARSPVTSEVHSAVRAATVAVRSTAEWLKVKSSIVRCKRIKASTCTGR